ncbi:c-type cytochrome domain-containing protein [Pedobacter sp. KR3-3]|uniref:C-type cytochrome domain-containing protein n=1 Tax=Pedobacter albus TaxID=3113905 RepID=A0ABU7I864_9SPHI|nr:c-type cytochrome domain-containing protein [Pedobacter sp. KR3-3]MEE1945662.1 c-type cytochrome domain-containing protein [Pedobacter sp. KR3-3]
MLELLGRFHPVLVHLPIGILLIACLFLLLSLSPKFETLKPAIGITLFLGMLGAVFSCITGYLLAQSGDYEGKLVGNHQWMGIATAAVSLLLLLVYKYTKSNKISGITALALIVLVSVTGHLGGSLTHGADYLTAPLKDGGSKTTMAIPPIANIQEALIYQAAIQPLLQNRCYSCHGSEKQKGKLRLDEPAFILKGGAAGHTVVPGKADESELIKRILLPISNEDHMAPKEKPQLTAHEIELLKWWINSGAPFNKKIKDLKQPDNIKPVLAALQKGTTANAEEKGSDIPEKEVGPASEQALKDLKDAGVMVVPVAQQSNYLSANFINANALSEQVMDKVKAIKDQLIWVKLERKDASDATLKALKDCKNIIRLSLNNSQVTDNGLTSLKSLAELRSLSLVGTAVSAKGVVQLAQLKKLQYIYLYQTQVRRTDWDNLKKLFPQAKLDSGNYQVPTLPKDTIEVKAPETKK